MQDNKVWEQETTRVTRSVSPTNTKKFCVVGFIDLNDERENHQENSYITKGYYSKTKQSETVKAPLHYVLKANQQGNVTG